MHVQGFAQSKALTHSMILLYTIYHGILLDLRFRTNSIFARLKPNQLYSFYDFEWLMSLF